MKSHTQPNNLENSVRAAIGSHPEGKSVILQVTIILGVVGLYMLIFPYLYHFRENGVWVALAVIPVMFAAWFWGFWAGIGAALVCSVMNMPLLYLVWPSGLEFTLRILLLSLVILTPIGGSIGRLRDLGRWSGCGRSVSVAASADQPDWECD
jgi:hypothetical protein